MCGRGPGVQGMVGRVVKGGRGVWWEGGRAWSAWQLMLCAAWHQVSGLKQQDTRYCVLWPGAGTQLGPNSLSTPEHGWNLTWGWWCSPLHCGTERACRAGGGESGLESRERKPLQRLVADLPRHRKQRGLR